MSAEAVHFNMHDAGPHLSRIIDRVERGEEVIIDRAGTPVAKIIPLVRRVNRAVVEGLKLATRDADIQKYDVDLLIV